jgi:hypothetical protein
MANGMQEKNVMMEILSRMMGVLIVRRIHSGLALEAQ